MTRNDFKTMLNSAKNEYQSSALHRKVKSATTRKEVDRLKQTCLNAIAKSNQRNLSIDFWLQALKHCNQMADALTRKEARENARLYQ